MPVFTEGKGVPFPRWQIEEDPSLMLMQIDAPSNAEHPDVLRYARMLSEALFKQGRREPNWWKYPRGTLRFNKIYGTKFSSKVPRGKVTGMPRRTAQPHKLHATKQHAEIAGPWQSSQFAPFETWNDVLKAAAQGERLWYQAPLDPRPRAIQIVKVFKNGKIRIDPLSNQVTNFTADQHHLNRFRRRV